MKGLILTEEYKKKKEKSKTQMNHRKIMTPILGRWAPRGSWGVGGKHYILLRLNSSFWPVPQPSPLCLPGRWLLWDCNQLTKAERTMPFLLTSVPSNLPALFNSSQGKFWFEPMCRCFSFALIPFSWRVQYWVTQTSFYPRSFWIFQLSVGHRNACSPAHLTIITSLISSVP